MSAAFVAPIAQPGQPCPCCGYVVPREKVDPASWGGRLLAGIDEDLGGVRGDGWRFLEAVVARASESAEDAHARNLARNLAIVPTTLMSRLWRLGLPSPKRYLAMAIIVRAAFLWQDPARSLARIALDLDWSSSQSFGRTVRTVLGAPPGELRSTLDGAAMVERFRLELVRPYAETLRTARLLAADRSFDRPRRHTLAGAA